MKKTFLYFAAMVMSLVAISSCSCSSHSGKDLLERIPADADVVFLLQTREALESAEVKLNDEGNQVTLPDYITAAFPEAQQGVDEFNEEMQQNGIDCSTVAGFMYLGSSNPIMVAKLNDPAKAEEDLKKNYEDASEEDGVKFFYRGRDNSYYKYQSCMAICDGYLYQANDYYYDESESPKAVVLKAIKSAKDKNFASLGIASKMTEYNLGCGVFNTSAAIDEALREEPSVAPLMENFRGYVLFSGNAKGSEATFTMELVDNDGDVKAWPSLDPMTFSNRQDQGMYDFMANVFNHRAAFNAKTVRYLPSDVNAVMGVNVGELKWSELIDNLETARALRRDEASMMRMVSTFLDSFKGSMVIGAGYNGTISDLANNSDKAVMQMSFGMVIETKSGKAKQTINDMVQLLNQFGANLDFSTTPNGLALPVPEAGMTIYISAADDMLVIANRPFTGAADNAVSENVKVGNSPMLYAVVLSPNHAIAKELGMDGGLTAYAVSDLDKAKAELVVKATGTSDKLFPMIIKTIVNVANNPELIRTLEGRNSYSYDDEYYEDYYEDEFMPDDSELNYAETYDF